MEPNISTGNYSVLLGIGTSDSVTVFKDAILALRAVSDTRLMVHFVRDVLEQISE